MTGIAPRTGAPRFFSAVVDHAKLVLGLSLVSVIVFGSFIPKITKDTRNESYMPQDHPAVLYRDVVKETFGLEDPMVVAVVADGPRGIFTPDTLRLIHWITENIASVSGIDPDRITSLVTENNITGTEDSMLVENFFDQPPTSQAEADRVRAEVMSVELYVGKLVSADATTALIVAEVLDSDDAQAIYERLLELVAQAPANGEQIHVAGEGATNGFVGAYIDKDAKRLNPVAFLVITVILILSYRTVRGVLLPLLVVIGSLTWSLGSMTALGVPFYGITNALTVALIAISVADGIHILGQYYEEHARHPDATSRDLVVRAMDAMWRPVTFTSLTSIAGFLALSFSSHQPPMRAFGVFATVGIGAALLFSLLVIPAALALIRPRGSRAFTRVEGGALRVDAFGAAVGRLGNGFLAHRGVTLSVSLVVIVLSAIGAVRVELEDARIVYFQPSEPIYQADQAINRSLDGTATLEIVIEANVPDALYRPDHLRRIEALQAYVETLPWVGGTISIVDYIKQMNRAMNANREDAYVIPDDPDLVAQYFLLYSASGNPIDFEEVVDYDFQRANLRVRMNRGHWSDFTAVVDATQRFVDEQFNTPEITATLAGAVKVSSERSKELRRSHPLGVVLAFVAVWLMAALSFGSLAAGTAALIPVALAVLFVYAVMGGLGIWLGSGTAMTVAIAIGLAVDFSVHTMNRLIVLMRETDDSLEEAFAVLFPSTGRALFFNFAAVLFGFGALSTSQVPSLQHFGLLVGVCIAASFFSTLMVLPSVLRSWKPKFLGFERSSLPTAQLPAEQR